MILNHFLRFFAPLNCQGIEEEIERERVTLICGSNPLFENFFVLVKSVRNKKNTTAKF